MTDFRDTLLTVTARLGAIYDDLARHADTVAEQAHDPRDMGDALAELAALVGDQIDALKGLLLETAEPLPRGL